MQRAARCGLLALLCGCLPADGRPVGGSVLVEVGASEQTREGFTTADGWEVRIDSAVVALGFVRLEETEGSAEACAEYSTARYDRLFDAMNVDDAKVGLVHGLGSCTVGYRAGSPRASTLLDDSATEPDLETMRVSDSDAVVGDAGIGLLVRGRAARGDQTITFSWPFRRSFRLSQCNAGDEITGGNELVVRIEVHIEELFRDPSAPDSPLDFARFQQADQAGDADLRVTFDELEALQTEASNMLVELYDLRLSVVTSAGAGSCIAEAE